MIGSCIKQIPIAGRDITYFIQQILRDRETTIPPEQSYEVAKAIKASFDHEYFWCIVYSVYILNVLRICPPQFLFMFQ